MSPIHAPKLVKTARLNRFDPVAQTRRADTVRRQAAARQAWNPTEKPGWLDERFYREQVQPRLMSIQLPKIKFALSVSEPYALKIRSGKCVPHPRHWLSLAGLVR